MIENVVDGSVLMHYKTCHLSSQHLRFSFFLDVFRLASKMRARTEPILNFEFHKRKEYKKEEREENRVSSYGRYFDTYLLHLSIKKPQQLQTNCVIIIIMYHIYFLFFIGLLFLCFNRTTRRNTTHR